MARKWRASSQAQSSPADRPPRDVERPPSLEGPVARFPLQRRGRASVRTHAARFELGTAASLQCAAETQWWGGGFAHKFIALLRLARSSLVQRLTTFRFELLFALCPISPLVSCNFLCTSKASTRSWVSSCRCVAPATASAFRLH